MLQFGDSAFEAHFQIIMNLFCPVFVVVVPFFEFILIIRHRLLLDPLGLQ